MLSPELTKFIFNYQNDIKKQHNKNIDDNCIKKISLKTKSTKFMTKLGFIPVQVEK